MFFGCAEKSGGHLTFPAGMDSVTSLKWF